MRSVIVAVTATVLWTLPSAAQDVAPSVLSSADVERYKSIFDAQERGELDKADSIIDELDDRILLGYVQHQRYMGRYYITRFHELSTWLSEYSDHFEANRIYNLALRKKGDGVRNPRAPSRMPWRGARFDQEAFDGTPLVSSRGERAYRQLRDLASDDNPAGAENRVRELVPSGDLPQEDIDHLYSYVAAAYLAEGQDADARRVAEAELAEGSAGQVQLHWVAGLASYRAGDFSSAALHFARMSERGRGSPRNHAMGAFWAALASMRAGEPAPVLSFYEHAEARPFTFYGMLAARVMGHQRNIPFEDPQLDQPSYARLVEHDSVRRAIALWQTGRQEAVETELARAFAETEPSLDPAFAALARALGAPAMELRAAESAAVRGTYLTSLYPVPPYEPEGGYRFDRAMVLAIARQESRFNPEARSRAGARGLMQIMPRTAAYITRDPSLARSNRDRLQDPSYSMRLGEDYLLDLLERQNGNLLGLVAAYNAGLGNLSRWLAQQAGNDDPLLFIESLPSPETRHYVKRVMMNLWMYQDRFGDPAMGMDEAAAGIWPIYPLFERIAAAER